MLNQQSHAYRSPNRGFLPALAISALLHAVLLGSQDFARFFSPAAQPVVAPAIYVRLPPLPEPEPLLKDSLSETDRPRTTRHSSVTPIHIDPPRPGAALASPPAARLLTAERKLAKHRFYPPEAVARGLEGEVRLLLILSPAGNVLEARIAGSSGHPLLDRAATEAVYAMHRISADGARELILPVIFKLQ